MIKRNRHLPKSPVMLLVRAVIVIGRLVFKQTIASTKEATNRFASDDWIVKNNPELQQLETMLNRLESFESWERRS